MSRVYLGSVRLPRSGVSPRQVARAGDVWRLLQEVAVDGSETAGHPPNRCRAEGVGFLISEMAVLHHAEIGYGTSLEGSTWVRDVRRETIFSRAVSLVGDGVLLAEATQRWVHVALDPAGPRPTRASAELLAAFCTDGVPASSLVAAPAVVAPQPGRPFSFSFEAWHTWMDPLGHANHPATIDWCDEAISRHLHKHGLDPTQGVPLAERVRFRRGVFAGDRLKVTLFRLGRGHRGVVFSAEVRRMAGETTAGELVGTATLERGTVADTPGPFEAAFD